MSSTLKASNGYEVEKGDIVALRMSAGLLQVTVSLEYVQKIKLKKNKIDLKVF